MVASFFTTLKDAGAGFVEFFISLIQSIWGIFYDTTGGTDGQGEWTSIGIFVIVALSISFVFMAIRWISRLVHLRG